MLILVVWDGTDDYRQLDDPTYNLKCNAHYVQFNTVRNMQSFKLDRNGTALMAHMYPILMRSKVPSG